MTEPTKPSAADDLWAEALVQQGGDRERAVSTDGIFSRWREKVATDRYRIST